MPFSGGVYTRTKSFANSGTILPSDLNSIQDDIGNKAASIDLRVISLESAGSGIQFAKSNSFQNENLTNGSFSFQDAVATPTITVVAGDYLVEWGARIGVDIVTGTRINAQIDMIVSNGSFSTDPITGAIGLAGTVAASGSTISTTTACAAAEVVTGVGASTLKLRVAGNATGTGVFRTYSRWIKVTKL